MSVSKPTPDRSQSHPSTNPDDTEYDHAPEDVYDEVIKADSTICQLCYRKQFAVAVVAVPTETAESSGDLLDWVPVSDPDVGDDTAYYEKFEATDTVETCQPPRVEDPLNRLDIPQSWKRATPPAQTVCECGAVDDDGNRPSLPTDEAVEHATRISDRLDDADVGHSRDHLLGAVERFKGIPKISGRDDDIFRHAVRIAVEKHRGRPLRSIRITADNRIEAKSA